jgi:hypothetical protein
MLRLMALPVFEVAVRETPTVPGRPGFSPDGEPGVTAITINARSRVGQVAGRFA